MLWAFQNDGQLAQHLPSKRKRTINCL